MNDVVDEENEKNAPLKVMQEARDILIEAKATLANIKNYEKELLVDTEERVSIKTKISTLESNVSEIFNTAETNENETADFYKELLGAPEDPDNSIVNKIKSAKKDILQILEDTTEVRSSLEKADLKVNGYANEDNEDENVVGLIEKVNRLITTNTDFHSDQVKDNETMVERINNQLSGATTVSLAKAYEDQQKKYILPNILWSLVFLASMAVMIGFAIDTFNHFTFNGATDAFIKIVSRSPIFLPLIWIGIFSSKQQSQNKRLQQEYAHKAAIAKSFEGYKEQIQQLIKQDEDGEITKKLLHNVIDAIKINPSDTLESKSHTDGSPMKVPNVGSAVK